ncbi:unnamed protein product, partial [Polarella glacialis]
MMRRASTLVSAAPRRALEAPLLAPRRWSQALCPLSTTARDFSSSSPSSSSASSSRTVRGISSGAVTTEARSDATSHAPRALSVPAKPSVHDPPKIMRP